MEKRNMDRFKFRVWSKKRCKWTHSDIMIRSDGDLFYQIDKEDSNVFGHIDDDYLENDYVFMQCTGVKDKYGILIYEGDILSGKDLIYRFEKHELIPDTDKRNHTVEWNTNINAFVFTPAPFKNITYRSNMLFSEFSPHLNILGNIHQNPELLQH